MPIPQTISGKVEKTEQLSGKVQIPPSKSLSIRALLAASLSGGTCKIINIANNCNTYAMKNNCARLGARIRTNKPSEMIVQGVHGKEMEDGLILNPMNSGIVLRLLMGVTSCLSDTTFVTDYAASLGKRSNLDMIRAIESLGGRVAYTGNDGRLPISICGRGLHGGEVRISGRKSSQFLSGLLFLGAIIDENMNVTIIDELKSKPMVKATITILQQGGVHVEASEDFMNFYVPASQTLGPSDFTVPSDPASSAALMAVSSIVKSDVVLQNFTDKEMGNDALLDHLAKMQVNIDYDGNNLFIKSTGELAAADFDGSQTPDAVLPLVALSCYAAGTSRFFNIEHIRYKESDRISDFRRELVKAGADVEETRSELIVHGKPEGIPGGVTINSHYDHAIVMALTAMGLRANQGIEIMDAQYVGQTFPDFFKTIAKLGCKISLSNPITNN